MSCKATLCCRSTPQDRRPTLPTLRSRRMTTDRNTCRRQALVRSWMGTRRTGRGRRSHFGPSSQRGGDDSSVRQHDPAYDHLPRTRLSHGIRSTVIISPNLRSLGRKPRRASDPGELVSHTQLVTRPLASFTSFTSFTSAVKCVCGFIHSILVSTPLIWTTSWRQRAQRIICAAIGAPAATAIPSGKRGESA